MLSGRLDREVTLLRMEEGNDPNSNEKVLIIAEEITVWASFQGFRSTDDPAGRVEISQGLGVFRIRYLEGFRGPLWKIQDDLGRLWDVRGEPVEIGRREAFDVFAELEQQPWL